MRHLITLGLLPLATALEASGDAVIRTGLKPHASTARALLMLGGGLVLYLYSLMLNLAPILVGGGFILTGGAIITLWRA